MSGHREATRTWRRRARRKPRRSFSLGNCVEAAAVPGRVLVRDSTDPDGPVAKIGVAGNNGARKHVRPSSLLNTPGRDHAYGPCC